MKRGVVYIYQQKRRIAVCINRNRCKPTARSELTQPDFLTERFPTQKKGQGYFDELSEQRARLAQRGLRGYRF